jgi:hypothetical protein
MCRHASQGIHSSDMRQLARGWTGFIASYSRLLTGQTLLTWALTTSAAIWPRCKNGGNAFAHGDPRAIDDALVVAVVDNLKREHEAWTAAFNHRGTRR